jgi:hypothetical protein
MNAKLLTDVDLNSETLRPGQFRPLPIERAQATTEDVLMPLTPRRAAFASCDRKGEILRALPYVLNFDNRRTYVPPIE